MTDQMPKPTGLSKPSVGNDDFFNQDFSKFGQPAKNLEVGGGDLAVGLAGSALRGTGTGIAEIGLSDLVRAGSALSDKLPGTQVLEYARRKLTGESEEEQTAKKAAALDQITGAVTDPIDNTIVKPIVNPIGTAIKEGGEALIENGTSADYKEALHGRDIFTGNGVSDFAIGDGAGDPAVWATKFTDGIGSLGGTLAVGALTGGTVKTLVKRQMLKRGASIAVADETARLAGIKWGQRGAMAEGVNMSTGQSADQARSQVDALSWDQLLTSKTFNDQVKEISRDPQFEGASATDLLNEARRRTADYAASIAKSDPKTWAAAAAGTLLGDAALFKMLQGTGAKGLAAGALQGMAGEGLGEAVEEGTQQYIGNEATNKAGGQDIDPMSGVMQAAATAGTIGALSGGGVGAIGGARGAHAPQQEGPLPGSQDQAADPVSPSVVPPFEAALDEVKGIERKQYGQHSIGRDGDKFRGAYVDELGNVQTTPAYSKIEDVRAAMGWPVPGQADNAGSSTASGDEFANVPAFQRQDGNRFKGWAEDSDVQRALAGEFGSSVQEIITAQMQSGDQGKTLQERVQAGELGQDPFAGGKGAVQVGVENAPLALPSKDIIFAGDANATQPGSEVSVPGAFDDKQAGTGPQFRGAERTRWQNGQEGEVLPPEAGSPTAGALPGRVIDGEAREVGTELPHNPFIAGQDNRDAVSQEMRRQAEQADQAEQAQNQQKQIGQSDTIFAPGTPGADNKNSAYTPPRLSREQVDNSLGEQSTRDPRSPVAQAIDQAGSEPDAIFGQLKTLRITKRGKPFASQKEAQLASRKTETPIALPAGGFGVVDKAELEQVQANQASVKQPSSNAGQLEQSASQEVTDGMPKQLPAPEAVRDETRQDGLLPDDGVAPTSTNTAPASDAGVAVSGSGKQRITIEQLTDKSIIVKGDKNDTELKARVEAAWPKAPPLYNERHKGWVFSSKREGAVREALADLAQGDVGEHAMTKREVMVGNSGHHGAKAISHTPSGKPVEVQYRMVEAGDLTASHDFDGQVNPNFPQELQPRDRSRAASRQQLFNIAQQPAPDRLTASAETDRGAPITKDGVVESGNGRVIGLTEAYRRGNAEAYREYLAAHAADFGFTPEQINGMKQPILIRERMTDMSADERRAFTVDSNKGASLSLGATEQAMADANGMDDAMLAKLMISEGGDVLAASNEAFLNDFATMLGNNELGTYKTQTGEWTSAYRQRVMNAIFAKGYGNTDLLANIAESANPEVKNLLNGLMNNAGKVATLRGIDADTGARLANTYSEAANLIGKSRRDKQSIQELNSQGDMLGGGASQEAKDLAAFIDTNMRSGKSISSILGKIANKLIESAKNRHQADIFSGDAHQSVTVGEAINAEVSERSTNQSKQPKPGNDLFGANPARLDTRESASVEGTAARSAGGSRSGTTKQGVTNPETVKIADFGEKIGGARKDVWTAYRDSIEGDTAEHIAELPLSKAWPAPDYQKLIDSGVDAKAVGLMRAAREAIPSKPRSAYKIKSWANAVKALRDLSMQLLDNSLDVKSAWHAMNRSSLRNTKDLLNKAELYQAVGHQRSLADLTLEEGEYSMMDGVHYSPAKRIWSMSREGSSTAFGNWPRMFLTGDTKEQVIAEFKQRYDQLTSEQTKPKAISFDIYSQDSRASWRVGKKVGRNYIPLSKPFEDLAAARRYREENHDTLVAELEKRKAIPNERRDINKPRVGDDMRGGADVTPEMFSNAFGFRGVEFGNWVEGSRRQRDLNDAYDALMDMAAVLDVHPKAISLNGQLGLAFGARGSGGVSPAAAHYEPGKVVINLTKKNGAGSLGHEWWHALDHYFGRMRGADESMSDARDVGLAARGSNYIHQGSVRKEMVDAFGAVKRAIDQTAIKARSSKLDGKRSNDYWTTDKEMSARAFESYLISKLQDQGASNDYLANIVDEETWQAMSSLGFVLDESYPYPTAGEIPGIRAGFDHLFDTIEQKEEGDRVALFSLSDAAPSARGMTKPELEMVVTDWSKQYKGAASARILVAANQKEMNEVLGMVGAAVPDGQSVNAAYLPGYKTLLLNAEAIENPKRARELMRHELLAHHGLREVVGDDAYISIIEAVKRGKDIKGIKDAYYQVAENYTDMHPDVQAEEVFAHWMEKQPDRGELAIWWRGIVRRVKDALRAVGLVGERTTEEEFNRVLDAIVTGMRNGRKPGRRVMESWHEAPAYSLGAEVDPFKPSKDEAENYRSQLGKAMASLRSGEVVIDIGRTPAVLRAVGAPDLTLRISRDTIRKATNGVKHDVPMGVIEQFPELLHDPIAVFDSKTHPGSSLVALLDAKDVSGRGVISAIQLKVSGGKYLEINRIASVHGRPDAQLNQWVSDGLVRYIKENHPGSLLTGLQLPLGSSMGGSEALSGTTQGLQLPKRGSPKRVSDSNILTADDIRNSGALFSLGSATADQSIIGKAESLAKAAPSSVLNWIKEQRGVGLGALTDLQIDQIYRGVTGGAVSRYQKLRTKMEADRNDILLDAETRIDPLWDALGKEQKKALSNLMHDATMAKLHPDLSLADNSLYQEVKQKLDRATKPSTKAEYQAELDTITANHKHLAERYSLGLSKEGKALYQTMRKTYDKQWTDLRDAIEQRLEDMMGAEGKTLAAELRLQMEHALKHGPYFPLARFGDYVVKATKGDEHIREHFERRKDAEQAIKQYQRDGYNAVMTVKEEGNGGQANSNALGMKVMQLLDKAGESGVSASAIKDDVWQAMLQMLPDASFAKHAIHRRRVKGASRDGHRAYLNSVYHYAHHVSKIRYGHQMQAELNKMNEQIQAGVHGEESNIKPEDLEVAQQVLNEMNKRHELNMNPKGAKWTGWAGNLGFMWYMAGSPASAIINMTQNFTVMLPQLGAKYGFVKASAAMAKALHDYAKHGKFKAGTKEAWVSLTRADNGITGDEKGLLNSLYKAGALDLTQAHSVAARADTDLQDVKPGAAWKRKTMAWLGSMFHNAEVLNREVAALAAYRLLKGANPNLTAEQYADQVTEMVYDGHGNYAASNRPRYMRGDVAKVLTQFKIYSQMMTYTLYRNAYLAAKGDKVALKTLGGVLGTHFIMAGVMGLPFPITAALYAVAAAVDDDDDRTGDASFRLGLAETLGPDLGELVARGPMDAVTGLSIAGRTGINDLWFREPKEGAEGDDLAWHVTQQIAGPVLGIGVQAARGLSMMSNGDYRRGAEAMMPKALKDLAKSYRQASDGERTRKGDVIIDDVSAFNVAMQAMGFSNAEMAKAYDAREYIKGKEGRIEDARSKLMSDYFMAQKDGDEDAMAEVIAQIREFNASHYRTEAITSRTIRQSLKSKQRSAHRTQGGVYLSRNREYLRGEGAFIGDDGTATN